MKSGPLLAPALLALRQSPSHSHDALLPRQAGENAPCAPVHIFLARGNNEPYPGRQGKLVEAICAGFDDGDCDYEDIQFNNPLPAPYCGSVTEGQANGVKQITEYSERCPKAKLVVSGYSQGGHVVGDVLGGGGGVFFQDCVQEDSEGLDADSEAGKKIVAAMIFADTRHTADQPYNVLSGAGNDGLFPRSERQTTNMAAYGDRLRDYCVESDPICAQGDIVANHLNYFDIYTEDAAAWVQEQVEAAGGVDDDDDDDETTTTTKPTSTKTTTTEETEETTETETTTTDEPTTTTEEAEETTSSETRSSASETETPSTTEASSSTVTSPESSSTGASETSGTETGSEPEPTDGGGDGEGGVGSVHVNLALVMAMAVGVMMMRV